MIGAYGQHIATIAPYLILAVFGVLVLGLTAINFKR
jgi:hypothetical protein